MKSQLSYWEGQNKRRHPSDRIIAAFVQPKLDFILNHVKLPRTPRILDVGCGNGYFTHYLERLYQCVAVDFAGSMLVRNPSSNLAQASAVNLPFNDHTFDMVFCSNLLHHMTDPPAALAEMKRTSRKYVVVHEPNRNNPLMLALGLVKSEERLLLRFTDSYLRSLARQAGLKVLAYRTMGLITPNRMPSLLATLAGKFNSPNPLGAYVILVARCDE